MIKYRLICAKEHEFDGWFSDMAAYDRQHAEGLLVCPQCNSKKVAKAIMAPAVPKKGNQADAPHEAAHMREMMEKLSSHVEENFDYVGGGFAEEARKIHYGEAAERDIYGETSLEEARDLLEEGVPVAPLPGPSQKQKN